MPVRRKNVKPNNYKSYKVMINDIDFSNIVSGIDIYQDVFSPNWTSTILITDAINIQNSYDIAIGHDVTIDIESDTPEPCDGISKKRFSFVIHSISNKTLIKKDIYGYIVNLMTTSSITDIKTRVSKSYKNKKPEAIANSILTSYIGGTAETSSSQEKYDVIIPNMSPFTAINYVIKFAKRPNKEADWIFFQTDYGKYKFKSLEEMFNDDTGWKLIHKEINYRENSNKEDTDAFIKIQKYSFETEIDGIKNLVSGFFGNKTIAHDIINKKIIENKYNYSDYNTQDDIKKPFIGSTFSNANDTAISYMTLHDGMTSESKSFHETHDTWEGSRRSNAMKLDSNRLMVELAGGVCWWKAIGKKINVVLPSQEDESSDKTDKYYKGSYVVLAIRHTIMSDNYTITMELGKKRLAKKLKDN